MLSVARLNLSGTILSYVDFDADEWPYCTLDDLRNQLDWSTGYEAIEVTINSPGGHSLAGFGMYDYLRGRKEKITTIAISQCSSIATAVFLAGEERFVYPSIEFLIHLPYGGIQGASADETAAYAEQIRGDEDKLIAIYLDRTAGKIDEATLRDLMKKETVLTAEQCVEYGFATGIRQPVKALALPNLTTKPAASGNTPAQKMAKVSPIVAAQRILGDLMKRIKGEAVKAQAVKTKEGVEYEVNLAGDKPAVGDPVTMPDGTAAPDTTITLEDGTVIVISNGVIESITEPTENSSTKTPEEIEAERLAAEKGAGAGGTKTAAELEAELTKANARNAELEQQLTTTKGEATSAKATAERVEKSLAGLARMIGTGGVAPASDDTGSQSTQQQQQGPRGDKPAVANSTEAKNAAAAAIQARRDKRAGGGK